MPPPQPSTFFLLLRKRKRERELSLALARNGNGWIPACAGMTGVWFVFLRFWGIIIPVSSMWVALAGLPAQYNTGKTARLAIAPGE